MGNCKDCRYWESSLFLCDAVESLYDVPPYIKKSPGDTGFGIAVVCDDDSGLAVGLKVGPLFGCVKYQGKKTI